MKAPTPHSQSARRLNLPTATLLLALLLPLTGCVAAIGNRDANAGPGTVGQQLIDLKKARDVGALTEEEYQSEKAKVLNHGHHSKGK